MVAHILVSEALTKCANPKVMHAPTLLKVASSTKLLVYTPVDVPVSASLRLSCCLRKTRAEALVFELK